MKISKLIAALAFAAVVALSSGQARAATTYGCTVQTIQYDGGPRIAIWCTGNSSLVHYVFGSGYGSCAYPASIDTIKLFHSMLQSALLAGKKVDLDYNTTTSTCAGAPSVRAVSAIRLQAN